MFLSNKVSVLFYCTVYHYVDPTTDHQMVHRRAGFIVESFGQEKASVNCGLFDTVPITLKQKHLFREERLMFHI